MAPMGQRKTSGGRRIRRVFQVCDLGPDPYSHDLLGKFWALLRKQLRSVVRSSCQNADVERAATAHFQCMLGCIERESLNCSHDQNWEEIGDAPL